MTNDHFQSFIVEAVSKVGSQRELSRELGVHESTMSRWVRGHRLPHPFSQGGIRNAVEAILERRRRAT